MQSLTGRKMGQKKEKIELVIPEGVSDKDKIIIKSKGNEHWENQTGDLGIITKIEPSTVFRRVKNGLYYERRFRWLSR